jgi:hypothetical protein
MRRSVAGALLGLSLLFGASVVAAQPKPGDKPGGAGPAPVEVDLDEGAESESEGAEPADGDESTTRGDPDLDAPPPKTTQPDGKKLSPLNPEPEEFPSKNRTDVPAELTALLSDIAALRGRVAALTTSLFRSKLRIYALTEGDDSVVASFVVTLDDGVVFRAPARFVADGERPIYEHAVAPGTHVIGIEIERHDARRRTYKTWQSSKFAIVVPENRLLEVDVLLEDDSDMAEDFPDDQDGEYELNVELRARTAE